ncbi:hypothetical protein HNP24_001202 [Chryseobacterium sediminis]|uniref:Uncharacterized protein n=1 Tax=Chryseobacterium sediminis TaxID=1679494 RepID=A0ABR6PX40_9FLAO|nr:hypothetical protein [Chryseobacterium sediminis]
MGNRKDANIFKVNNILRRKDFIYDKIDYEYMIHVNDLISVSIAENL